MKRYSANYTVKEVRGLVEGYAELYEAKDVSGGGLLILCKLADLDVAMKAMPPKEYRVVFVHGMLRNTSRDSEVTLGISARTVLRLYDAGLLWITRYLNGSFATQKKGRT